MLHSNFAPTPELKCLQAALDNLAEWAGGLTLAEDELQVLDLACGDCREAFTLGSWLSNLYHPIQPRRVEFLGLDIREAELKQAADRCQENIRWFDEQGFRPPWLNVDFKRHDVSRPIPEALVPAPVDVVFIRHQNTWNGAAVWVHIFENALKALKPEGYLIITSFFDEEHEQGLKLIRGMGGEVLVSMPNEKAIPLAKKGQSFDRRLALVRRGEALL